MPDTLAEKIMAIPKPEGPWAMVPLNDAYRSGFRDCRLEAAELARQWEREQAEQGGPISEESITLDELLNVLAEWKAVASGRTCVSFENLSYGASSLWHQTHRENFRKIDRKPEALSRWMLDQCGSVNDDFPAQVLALLQEQQAQVAAERAAKEVMCDERNDLAMLVRRLCYRLRNTDYSSSRNASLDLIAKAADYLRRKNLQGSPLRDDAPVPTGTRDSTPADFDAE